jgi:Phage-related minor tail protein.
MAMDMTTALTIKANVVGQSQIGGLEKGLGRVTGQTNKATTAMGRLRGAASGALGAMRSFLPVLGVAGIAAFAKSNLDAADSMSKLSQRTGIAAPTLDKFRKVAELSDTSIQSLERAFPALTKNMDMAAQKGKGPAFEAFQRLGVAVKDSSGNLRDADAVMLDIADRFQGMADGSEKAALASAVFGTRIGSELIPLLNSGGDAVRNMGTALTQEFADKAAAFNDRLEEMQEKFGDLGLRLTEALLPALESLVGILEGAMNAFSGLPGPIQSIVAGVTALGIAMGVLAPVIGVVNAAFGALAALKIGATIAGFAPVIAGVGSALSGLLPIIAGVFTGPVGWAALLVGAGAAIFAFRDQIGEFLNGILQPFRDTFRAIGEAIKAPFQAVVEFIKGIINNVIGFVEGAVNNAINAINNLIRGVNRLSSKLGIPAIPTIGNISIPRFAKGGMVNGAQLAMVGEAGPEYIVPAGKAQGFAQNILAGVRGPAAIPAYAEGGYVGPVNITTGPVMQQGGTNYVTMAQFEAGVRDVAAAMTRSGRSYGSRRFTGIS